MDKVGGQDPRVLGRTLDAVLPESYARWRSTRIGELTERIERDLVLDFAGPLAGLRVLDVGCGDGMYAVSAARQGAIVTAADQSDRMLKVARERAAEAGVDVRFERADAGRLPFADRSFDLVIAVTVLCFVEEPARALEEAARVLAPGGRLVLADLNRWNTWSARRRVRGWLGLDTWRRARFRSMRALTRLAEYAGLAVERTSAAIYYPPNETLARLFAPADRVLGAVGMPGAAFIVLAARK